MIVRQGGTKEPSIQLVGGAAGEQASHKQDTAAALGAAENNLKKIAGRQLSASQQDQVSQIRQFIQQSRSAVQAGDLERASTLAGKAKQLSEELVNPEN